MKHYTLKNIYKESLIYNPVIIRKVIAAKDRWKTYELINDIPIQLSNEKRITIEKSFKWDLSSVPRIFWSILPPDGDFIIAALIHDWLYVNKEMTKSWFNGDNCKARNFTDKEMLKWSLQMNKGRFLKLLDNYVRYIGVFCFGWIVWYSEKAKIKKLNQEFLIRDFQLHKKTTNE